MRAFWWFREDKIAGMARPGFNEVRWRELPFDESVMLGWLGQFSIGAALPIQDLHQHVQTYGRKIAKMYLIADDKFDSAVSDFYSEAGISQILKRLYERTGIFSDVAAREEHVHFEFCTNRLNSEILQLKNKKIESIITLTERHHAREELQKHFDVHHLSIEDLNAPRLEQAHEMAEILKKSDDKKIAVHCLAGIGRTSTMILAAHMLLGEDLGKLTEQIAQKNSAFALSLSQKAFLKSVEDSIKGF